jgi:hypothetical protein
MNQCWAHQAYRPRRDVIRQEIQAGEWSSNRSSHAGVRLQIVLQRCEGSAVYQGRFARQENL